jgi:hypothetical protein
MTPPKSSPKPRELAGIGPHDARGDREPVPFDDVLRKLLASPPKPRKTKKPNKPAEK